MYSCSQCPMEPPPALQSPKAEVPSLRLNTSDDYDSETWIRTKFWKFWKIEIDYISVIWTKNSWYLTGVEELQGLKVFMGANFVYAFSFLVTSNTCTSQPRDVDLTTCRNNKKQKKIRDATGRIFRNPCPGISEAHIPAPGILRDSPKQGISGNPGDPRETGISVKNVREITPKFECFCLYKQRNFWDFFLKQIPESRRLESKFPTPKIPGECQGGIGMGNDSSLVASMGGTKNLGHSLAS